MNEFAKVMRNWRRMCDTFSKQYGYDCCEYCPMDHLKSCGAMLKREENAYENIAETVEAWAAIKPEPQYPTWAEWMYDNFLFWCQKNYPHRAKDEKAWFDYLYENPIPPHIAEKLGVKPKGGNEND